MPTQGYAAAQLTLTDADTNYSLYELLSAIEPNCPITAREMTIQAAVDNGQANVLVGDSQMSGTRFGMELVAGAAHTYRSGLQNVLLGSIFVRCGSSGKKVNIEVMAA